MNKVCSDKQEIKQLFELCRDYRKLFNRNIQTELLKPNSGFSLKFV